MQVVSKFAVTKEIFFSADDSYLPPEGVEIVDRTYKNNSSFSVTKAFLLKELMLHYTYNEFKSSEEFTVSFNEDMVIISFHLKSGGTIDKKKYEPYLICGEEFISAQFTPAGESNFKTPLVMELFRLFMTRRWYCEILSDYGDTFSNLINSVNEGVEGNIFPSLFPISPQMKIIIREIISYKNRDKNLCRNFCKTKALELIHLQLEQLLSQNFRNNSGKLNPDDIKRIGEAKKILDLNYCKPPTVKQLANMLATNENKLKSGFNKILNTSIYQYVLRLKIEKSIELMRNKNLTIEQISYEVGYVNLTHFTRAFKKLKGVSPSAFRTSI